MSTNWIKSNKLFGFGMNFAKIVNKIWIKSTNNWIRDVFNNTVYEKVIKKVLQN